MLAQLYRLQERQFDNILKMEYSCSRVVFLLYEAFKIYLLWMFKLSDTKLCDNLKMCNFSIRQKKMSVSGHPTYPKIFCRP